jgi:hypothetical protein
VRRGYYLTLIEVGVALEGYVYIGEKKRSEIAFINTDPAIRHFYISLWEGLGTKPHIYDTVTSTRVI